MRKFFRTTLAFVICSLVIFSFVYAEENETNNTTNTAATDLQTQRNEIQNQMNEANEQLEGVQNDISENLQQVQKLDEKISNSQQELDELNKKIEDLENSSEEVEKKLKTAEENYDKQKKLLDSYLVAVQESSDTQYLDVLLSSKNISEFLSNYFLITELANSQVELLEDMQNKKNEIQQSKEKLDKNKEDLAVIKANQTKTATVLANTKTVRENFISKLSDQEKVLVSRARRVQFFLSQNFNVAEQFTGLPGSYVPVEETVKGFREILEGKYDDLPEEAFRSVGRIEDVVEKAKKLGY